MKYLNGRMSPPKGGGTGHNFLEIKKGSGLEMPLLAEEHYLIFLYVRLAFLLTKF